MKDPVLQFLSPWNYKAAKLSLYVCILFAAFLCITLSLVLFYNTIEEPANPSWGKQFRMLRSLLCDSFLSFKPGSLSVKSWMLLNICAPILISLVFENAKSLTSLKNYPIIWGEKQQIMWRTLSLRQYIFFLFEILAFKRFLCLCYSLMPSNYFLKNPVTMVISVIIIIGLNT